jgi:hypothetical protein
MLRLYHYERELQPAARDATEGAVHDKGDDRFVLEVVVGRHEEHLSEWVTIEDFEDREQNSDRSAAVARLHQQVNSRDNRFQRPRVSAVIAMHDNANASLVHYPSSASDRVANQ